MRFKTPTWIQVKKEDFRVQHTEIWLTRDTEKNTQKNTKKEKEGTMQLLWPSRRLTHSSSEDDHQPLIHDERSERSDTLSFGGMEMKLLISKSVVDHE